MAGLGRGCETQLTLSHHSTTAAVKVHRGEKPNRCNRSDSEAGALGTRLRTHTGEKLNEEGRLGGLGRGCEPEPRLSHDTRAVKATSAVHYLLSQAGVGGGGPEFSRWLNLNSHGLNIPSHCCYKTADWVAAVLLIQATDRFPLHQDGVTTKQSPSPVPNLSFNDQNVLRVLDPLHVAIETQFQLTQTLLQFGKVQLNS